MVEPADIEEDDEDEPDATVVVVEDAPVEASFDELLSKSRLEEGDDEDDDSVLEMTREERLESLAIRAVPKQANEFVCSNCHLVKNNSQLADKKRGLCKDCV